MAIIVGLFVLQLALGLLGIVRSAIPFFLFGGRKAQVEATVERMAALKMPKPDEFYGEVEDYFIEAVRDPATSADGKLFAGATTGNLQALQQTQRVWLAITARMVLEEAIRVYGRRPVHATDDDRQPQPASADDQLDADIASELRRELGAADGEASDEDMKGGVYIQQKAQIGTMFAGRLHDPNEDQDRQRSYYERIRDELLLRLDRIDDEFVRGFATHQLIEMCMAGKELPIARALLVGVRDRFLRERIFESAPSRNFAAAPQGEIAALMEAAGRAQLVYAVQAVWFGTLDNDPALRDKSYTLDTPNYSTPVYRASIGPRLGLLGTSICADVATVLTPATVEPKTVTVVPRIAKIGCEGIIDAGKNWLVSLDHVQRRLASISEGTTDPGPLPKTTVGNVG